MSTATLVSRVTSLFASVDIGKDASSRQNTVAEKVPESVVPVTTEAAKQPDIEYHPNEEKWKARTARRLAEDPALVKTPLPAGFPQKLDSPLVWEGKDWKDPETWEYTLSDEQLQEIDDAVKHFNGMYLVFRLPKPSWSKFS